MIIITVFIAIAIQGSKETIYEMHVLGECSHAFQHKISSDAVVSQQNSFPDI